jgi:hypothetical protein
LIGSRKARAVVFVASVCAATSAFAALTASAPAEVTQKDGVRVSVTGKMTPTALPRAGAAPVAISVAGHIAATQQGTQPKLESITLAINSHGKLQNRGIPRCRLGRISPSTTAEALAACRSSLIGEGHFSADVRIPEQSPFPSQGKLLAFNGRISGQPAIFAHIYGTQPVPTSYVLPFVITKGHGTFGTVLRSSLPRVTGEWGYVTGVSLKLQPRFLSAGCPAPSGFNGAVFPLMKTEFGFAQGLKLQSTLTRSCKVK